MSEVSAELAAKVVSADLRNLIKKIGDGGTLTTAERQMFIDFSNSKGDPGEMHRARINALLRKWLNGARLSRDEREEIAHILPDRPAPEKAYVGKPEDNAARIGLSRRPFFRWQNYGKEHNDPLPCHDPPAVPAWYERMRTRGIFEHKCPQKVVDACRKGSSSAPAGRPAPDPPSGSIPETPFNAGGLGAFLDKAEVRDLRLDIEDLQRTLHVRQVQAQTAYTGGKEDEGNRFLFQAGELLDRITLNKQRLLKIEELEQLSYPKADLAHDLGGIVRSVVTNLLQQGRSFHAQCGTTLQRDAFLKIWRSMVKKVTTDLVESKYAPPMELEAEAA